jgi:hypothetical protein
VFATPEGLGALNVNTTLVDEYAFTVRTSFIFVPTSMFADMVLFVFELDCRVFGER